MKKLAKVLSLFAVSLGLLVGASSYASTLQGGYLQDVKGNSQWFFDQTSASSPLSQAQCTAAWVSKNYYLAGDVNGDGVKDDGSASYLRDNFIVRGGTLPLYFVTSRNPSSAGTQIRYYTPEDNMLSVLNGTNTMPLSSKNTWYRLSKVAPKDQWVRAVESEPVLYSVPQSGNPLNNTFQVAYNIFYRSFKSKGTATSEYSVWPVADGNDFRGLYQSTDRWALNKDWTILPRWQNDFTKTPNIIDTASINWETTEIEHGYECFNVKVSRCGDGVLDNTTFDNSVTAAEQCDLGADNGKSGSLCSATCTIIPKPAIPDVSIVKSVEGKKSGYMTGDTISYKLIIRNIGTGNATNVVVADQLPAGVTYVANSAKLGTTSLEPTYNTTSNILTWNIGSMPAGYYNEITFQVKLNQAPYCAPFKNDASIEPDAKDGETNKTNNYSSDTFTTSCDNPDVITTKAVSAISGSYLPGQTVLYTLTYKNQGSGTANGVVVTDTLPAEVTYVANSSVSTPNIGQPTVAGNKLTWNVGTLAANQGGTITIRVTINATTPVCTNLKINNNFTISATNEPNTLLDNNPSIASFLMDCVDLWSLKSVDKTVVKSGDIVTYTLTYGNSGSIARPGQVVDTLPAKVEYIAGSATSSPNFGQPTVAGNKLTWNVGLLQPGARGTISFKVRILGPVTENEVIKNNVCISEDTYHPHNNCDDVVIVTKPDPTPTFDLSIDKTPKMRQVTVGEEFDYTLKVSNNGMTGVNNFTVKDYLPKGLEYVSSSNNGTYTSANKTITWKGLNIGAVDSFNLTVRVKYVGPVTNGVETNWTEICDYNGIGVGSGQNKDNPYDTDSNPCNGTGNNEDDVSSGSIVPIVPKPTFDLSIDKTPKMRQVTVGEEFDYTLKVSNNGMTGVNNFTVKDYLPKGLEYVSSSNNGIYTSTTKTITWKGLTIGAVDSFNLTVRVKYVGPVTNGVETNWTEICDYNGVGVGSGQNKDNPYDTDSNPCNGTGNNEDDVSSGSIVPSAIPVFDLSIDKLVNGKKSIQAKSGDIVDFSLTVTNAGPATATGFTVKDYLPAGFIFVQASAGGHYVSNSAGNVAPGTLTWTGLTLKAGEKTTLTFKAQYIDNVTRTNWTEICDYNGMGSGSGQDSNKPHDTDSNPCNGTGNNEDDVSSASVNPVSDYFDLELRKLIDGQTIKSNVKQGTVVTVSLAVTNSGTVGVTGFSVKDYMPQDLEYKDGTVTISGSATSASAAYSATTRELTISNLTIGAKGTITITFQATYNGTVARTNYTEICDYNGKSANNDNPKDIDSDPCNVGGPKPGTEDDDDSAQITPYTPSTPPSNGSDVCGNGIWAPTRGEVCDMGANGGRIPAGAGYPADAVGKYCYGLNPPAGKMACTYDKPSTSGPVCGDGIRQAGEICDMGANGGTIPAGQPYAGRHCYGTTSKYACNLRSAVEDAPTCSYIDPPSIQKNEYLPIWWDIASKVTDADLNENNLIPSCTTGNVGKILKDKVLCDFTVSRVVNGDTQKVAELKNQKCFDTDDTNKILLNSAYEQTLASMGYTKEEFPKPAGLKLLDLRGKFGNTLGEYVIDVKVSSFEICGEDGTISKQTTSATERTCQMNFAVTEPYMVSRGTLGDFSTTSLTNYFQFPKGDAVFTSPVPLLTTSYAPTTDTRTSVDKLIADYQKIAVKADGASFDGVTVYKVPNKEVYIFEGKDNNSTITIGDSAKNAKMTKPFTLIVTRGKLVVKGNLKNANGMYIAQNGDIQFVANSCNVTNEQVVNGIFISLKNITSSMGDRTSAHNTDSYKSWCSEGALTINGVLIGNNINSTDANSLLGTRRSNLNTWFEDLNSRSTSGERQESLKKNAAVVLQYNPSIFSNLPPGADTLSQVLSVSKK